MEFIKDGIWRYPTELCYELSIDEYYSIYCIDINDLFSVNGCYADFFEHAECNPAANSDQLPVCACDNEVYDHPCDAIHAGNFHYKTGPCDSLLNPIAIDDYFSDVNDANPLIISLESILGNDMATGAYLIDIDDFSDSGIAIIFNEDSTALIYNASSIVTEDQFDYVISTGMASDTGTVHLDLIDTNLFHIDYDIECIENSTEPAFYVYLTVMSVGNYVLSINGNNGSSVFPNCNIGISNTICAISLSEDTDLLRLGPFEADDIDDHISVTNTLYDWIWPEISVSGIECMVPPLAIFTFNGVALSDYNHLYWDIAEEENCDYFLQVSKDANDWETLLHIDPSSYKHFNHHTPEHLQYYRIIEVNNNDLSIKYSNIISLNRNVHLSDIILFPNPAENILYIDGLDGDYTYSIYDLNSRLIKSDIAQSNNFIDISGLSDGYYLIKLCSDTSIEYKKFVVRNR